MPNNSLIPPENDPKAGLAIFELLHKVIKDKEDIGVHDRIKRNHELKMGKHWKSDSGEVPLVVANMLWNHMNKNVNLLTDNNPIFNVAKIGEIEGKEEDNLDIIQRTAEHWWNEHEQQAVFEDTVNYGEEYGVTIEYTKFNRHLEESGEVETLNIDPLYFGFYPPELKNPRDLNKCDAVFYFYPMSVREVKRRWKSTGQKVKPDSDFLDELDDDRREISQAHDSESKFFGALITLASEIKQMLSFKFGVDGKEEETLVVECWCKDYSDGEPWEEDDENGNKVQKNKPKYPGYIRRVITCNGGKVVLSDDPNPSINPTLIEENFDQAQKSYLWDKYPFYMRNSVRDTSSAWGQSDMEQLDKLMMEFNKALSQLVLTKDRKARSKIINPLTSGVDNSEFTNLAGIINPSNATEAAAIRYLTFDGDMRDFIQAMELFKDIFYTVAGTFELDQAQSPGRNVIAYKAIAALIEQASTMRKNKIRAYSAMIRIRGRAYISLGQNWYTEERWITYKKDGASEAQMITRDNLFVPAKLTVVTGSTMPVSKVQKREEAIVLYEKGVIDQEALLEDLDWTNRKEILMRMKAGPFGVLGARLHDLQMPDGLVEYITQLGMMDDKDFRRAKEKGELIPFPMIFERLMAEAQGQQVENPELDMKQQETRAKALESSKKAEKIDAEITLINAKVKTEEVERYVKLRGVDFDEEELKIRRQELLNKLAEQIVAHENQPGKAGYNEKGMKSNNA